jgi:hypothetical protein
VRGRNNLFLGELFLTGSEYRMLLLLLIWCACSMCLVGADRLGVACGVA